jgi:hypothetical protein
MLINLNNTKIKRSTMTHIKLYKKLRIEIHELYVHKRYFKVSEIK